MGAMSIWHWLIVIAVALLLFGGGGKISSIMGDFGKGLRNFKKSMKEEGDEQGSETEAAKSLKSEESAGTESKADQAQKS
ncbi:MAG: twin-arginine translocase TatA/TatE family subunit [Nisaea sp.]|jgi:sec-independent protein translocase protein TatA|uniref:twin-arginine translocase TatA/TatE family subunit n=1 Tax=Nisaea sp. TaxID=2024842 RepID=UPI001B030CD0|nr:twin-arginine translocase TatA/TatE family subunit [Nisaea sp.]MBO6558948.1 twin-arginine translocase TatA/TatE family subunit [Nisaea sp.]